VPLLDRLQRADRVVVEHCIDHLRQSLMCTGDMTLIKTFWIEKRQRIMADFNNDHMCRNFDALKSWSRSRNAEANSPWRENADRLLAADKNREKI
jgi:hypothetical protein